MDSHFILKMIHLVFGSLALLAFLVQAAMLFQASRYAPAKATRIVLMALQHLSFTVLILSGMVLLYQNQFVVQPWFYGKIILFVVIISASLKAFGKREISLAQRKAGAFLAAVAFAGLFTLVIWKPDFSDNAVSRHAAQSVMVDPKTLFMQQGQLTRTTISPSAIHLHLSVQ